jgi:RHS repeat-associated protein
MSSNTGKKDIAHTGSGHGFVMPAAMSLVSPPAPPAPTPFAYTGQASNAKDTDPKIIVQGSHKVLVEGSTIPLDPPANQPSQTGGGDALTHQVKNIGVMTTGSWALSLRGKGICATGDMVAPNVVGKQSQLAQGQVPLLAAGDFEMAKGSEADMAFMNEYYTAIFPPSPAKRTTVGHPVDVATGAVVDDAIDLQLTGPLRLTWSRAYCSAAHVRTGALGRAGWCHSFEQYVEPREEGIRLWDENGRPIDLPLSDGDATTLHRGERLETRRAGRGVEIRSLEDRLIRVFSPLPSGKLALREIRDSYLHRITLEYDSDTLVRIIDSAKREIRILNDLQGRVSRVEVWSRLPGSEKALALQTWFDYAYHPEGDLASHADALGHAEGFEYDGLHRMIKATLRNGVSFHYEYDPEGGYCCHTFGDDGLHEVRINVDRAASETTTHGTERARLYRFKKGVVLREETFDGSFVRERSFDADGLREKAENGAGEAYEYQHDARGNLVLAKDPAGNEWRWEHVNDRPVRYVEPGDLVTECHHDAHGALIAAAFPDGSTRQIQRDVEGRVTAVLGRSGPVVKLTYDEHSNVASRTTAGGGVTRFEYDALGAILTVTQSDGGRRAFTRDRMGQIVEATRPDGARVQGTYDRLGKLSSLTDENGRTTRFDYQGTGVIARATLPNGEVYLFRYDKDERLIEVTNPRLETTRMDYDRADQITGETTFDGRRVDYRRDKAGRVARVDHPEGEWREYGYDALGHLIEDRGEDVQIAFERDALGRVVKATCQDSMGKAVTEIRYDALGRVVADIQNGREVRYEHDSEGRRSARILQDGERLEYHYDATEALIGVTFLGKRLTFERDAAGRERRRYMGSWAMDTAHDVSNRIQEQRVAAYPGGDAKPRMVSGRRYKYDPAGKVSATESLYSGTTTYEHDAADRLLAARGRSLTAMFEHDAAGSIIGRRSGSEISPPWSIARGNRLKATERALYWNDARGRRIRRLERADDKDPREAAPRGDERETIYGWDTKDRLREVILPDGTRLRFSYDAFGRRTRKDVLGPPRTTGNPFEPPERRTITYTWDGPVLCEEIDSSKPEGSEKRLHAHEPRTRFPLLQAEQGQVLGVVTDRVGVPKELVDESGRVAWRAEHGPFGEVLSTDREPGTAAVESPFRLLGQLADPESGLQASFFRWLDPLTGRWLSPDPLGLDGGMDLYEFDGSPIMVTDPWGLCVGGPGILFGQKRAAPTFRNQGPNPKLAGKTLEEVAEMLKSGEIHPDEIPVHYFIGKDGQRIADNNRGLAVLAMAGMHPTQTVEIPNHPDFDNRLKEGTKDHPLPNSTLPITRNKDGSGVITVVNLDGSET